jgi:hypothetical protein
LTEPAQAEAAAIRTTWAAKAVAVAVPAFVVLYLFVLLGKAAHAPAWVDEVFTRWMVERVPARQLTAAVIAGADCQPPTYYLLLKGICRVFGNCSYFALRLPSVLGFLMFGLATFWLLQRRFPIHLAALGLVLPVLTQAGNCAVWARPYALLAGWRLAGMWAALGGAMLLHFYAVLLVPVLGTMELLWWWRHRRIRWTHLVVLLLAIVPALIWLPLLAPLHRIGASYSAGPRFFGAVTPWAAASLLVNLVWTPGVIFMASGILLTALFSGAGKQWKPMPVRDLDIIVAGCLVLPLLTYIFAKFVTHILSERYFFESAMIASLGAALLLNRLPIPVRASAGLLGLAMVIFAFGSLEPVDSRNSLLSEAKRELPIVVANGSDFFELTDAMPKAMRDRLVFMTTPEGVIAPDPSAERIAAVWKPWYPSLRFVQAEDFLRENQEFYLLATGKVEGITHWILNHGALSMVDYNGSTALFLSSVNRKYTTGSAKRLLSMRSSTPP